MLCDGSDVNLNEEIWIRQEARPDPSFPFPDPSFPETPAFRTPAFRSFLNQRRAIRFFMNQMRLPEFVVKRLQHDFSESVFIWFSY
jgi:hypothetical protein